MRNKLCIAFLVVLIPLMFPINWFFPPKPENDLRNAVNWAYGGQHHPQFGKSENTPIDKSLEPLTFRGEKLENH